MENYLKLCQILKDPHSDKLSFLDSLLSLTLNPCEIDESQESVYQKSILYITCWVLLPKTSISSLPSDFQSVYSLLDTNTSSLFPKFHSLFLENYKSLPELICNDTLLSVILTIPEHNSKYLELLSAHHCIGPLLWLLTYSPEHLQLASEFLPRAIMKKGGVQDLIDCFSKGDNTWKLKNLYIKMLKTTPKNNKQDYVQSVIAQVVEIMTEYKCDKITENIMEEISNFYLQKFPGFVLPWIHQINQSTNMTKLIKFYRIFSQYLPPNRLILFGISQNFDTFMALWLYLNPSILQIKNELLTIFVQFFVYWEGAGHNFCEFIEKGKNLKQFRENSNGEIEIVSGEENLLTEADLFQSFSLLNNFSEVSGASIILSKLFAALLERYNQSHSSTLLACLTFLLESTEPILLVNMPKNTEQLIKTCIDSNDEKLLKIAFQILLYVPDDYLSKSFLLYITPKLLNFKSDPELADIISELNTKISKIITDSSDKTEKNDFSYLPELSSNEDYLNAIGLHQLSLSINENTEIPWELVHSMLYKQIFVFGEAVKVYVKAIDLIPNAINEVISKFTKSSDEVKQRFLEIMFFYCKEGKNVWEKKEKVLEFIDSVILNEKNEDLVNGALVVAGQMVRRLKNSFFPYAGQCLHWVVGVLKLANSRLISKGENPKSLSASLVVLKKIIKHCTNSVNLDEISDLLGIFCGLFKNWDSSLGIIVKNVKLQVDELIVNSLE